MARCTFFEKTFAFFVVYLLETDEIDLKTKPSF